MGLFTPLAIRIGAIEWMPKLLPQVVWLDKNLHKVSGGRVTVLDIAGLPNLNLTVKGRKSGIERTTPAAVRAGRRHHPDRRLLLRRAQDAAVGGQPPRRGRRGEGRVRQGDVRRDGAELADPERAEAWKVMLETWPNYAKYEERTDRLIPVFRLTRA